MKNYNIQPRGPGTTPAPPMGAFMSSARAAMAHLGSPTGNPGEGRLAQLNARLGHISQQASIENSLMGQRLGAQESGMMAEHAAGADQLAFQGDMGQAKMAMDREHWEHEHGEGGWFDKLLTRYATLNMLGESVGDMSRAFEQDPEQVAGQVGQDATDQEIQQSRWGDGVRGGMGRGLDWLNRQLGQVFPGLKSGTKEHAQNYASRVRISQKAATQEDLDNQLNEERERLASVTKQLEETVTMYEEFNSREPYYPWVGQRKWADLAQAAASTAESIYHNQAMQQETIRAVPEFMWPDYQFELEAANDRIGQARNLDMRKRARSFAGRALEAW